MNEKYPEEAITLGWWKQRGMTVEEFFQTILVLGEIGYPHHNCRFGHNLVQDGIVVGEAAFVEEVGGGSYLGLVSIKGKDAKYGFIPHNVSLQEKEHND